MGWWADGDGILTKTCQDAEALGRSICKKQPRCATVAMDGSHLLEKKGEIVWCMIRYLDLVTSCPSKIHTSSFVLDIAFWVVEWVWSIHTPYCILPLHPCQSHAMSAMSAQIHGYRGFLQVLAGELPQVKKDSDLFNTMCSRQNRIHRILLSHRENFMTGLCLFWRWSRMYPSN